MSTRHYRRLYGNSLPPVDSDDSNGEYDPLANRRTQKSTYEGLTVSDSPSEPEPEDDDEEDAQEAVASSVARGGARRKIPQKKVKGKKRKSGGPITNAAVASTSSRCGSRRHTMRRYEQQNQDEELDEIDRSILEVNALLGEPPPAPERPKEGMSSDAAVLQVVPKHINVFYELKRLFGPEHPEEIRLRNKNEPHRKRILKRVMIGPTNTTAIYDFKKTGLSMSIVKREQGLIYFVYVHDQDHQKMHRAFLLKFAENYEKRDKTLLNLEEARKNMHVEPLLEIADTLFRMEENSLANEIVENVVTYLQYVAHPSFNLSNLNVRLLYTYIENRPFHVAMVKYMYLLSNKACHRTALEISKMLLNIDPSDPLAIVFVIDTFALRAREHQWLIDAIQYFTKKRDAIMLFNIQYSFALAHFHVARKNKTDFSEANKYLQSAILSYPRVVSRILECANVTDRTIQRHSMFTTELEVDAGEGLSELMLIYAKLTWARWREPQVIEWFLKNATVVLQNYNINIEVRQRVRELAMLRHNIFEMWPTEILRHISIIRSMSNLLMETTLVPAPDSTSSWDPLFDRGIDRYGYRAPSDPLKKIPPRERDFLYNFFMSVMPNIDQDP